MRQCRNFLQDTAGASAAEFALVFPVLAILLIGTLHLCIMVYANSTLQFAVDDAARCESVKTTICPDAGSTQTHAATTFGFANLTPNFVASNLPCGYQVVGTATYALNAVVTTISVPLSATSCFPVQN